jgi:hypothetical protein
MVTTDFLKARGWTKVGIDRFLGEADATQPHPKYPGASQRLFRLARVESVEQTAEHLAWRKERERRGQRGQVVAAARAAKLHDEIRSWKPEVGVYPLAECRRQAIAEHNAEHSLAVTETSAPDFLDMVTLMYIRDHMTNFTHWRGGVRGKTGSSEALQLAHRQVCSAIADAYPDLAKQCAKLAGFRLLS